MNINHIKSLIEDFSEISAWEIRKIRKKSYQRYLVFDQIESQRVVETEKYIVTIHKEYEIIGEKVLGETTVFLSEGDNGRERLAQGLEMAVLVANPIFHLPEKGLSYDQVQTLDAEVGQHPHLYLDCIQEDLAKTPPKKVKR
ncbi:MAG: hypothetical protein MUQ20_02440, partial [Deltaproteobacteria bacterium]|nr:hypothetical protein [Deltaproteobacteria bacterium]